jgi:recombination protein RecR
MGALSPLDGIGPDDLRLKELVERASSPDVHEIIVATNPTMEGDATAQYIYDLLRDHDIRVSRIAHGISTGGAIEYADRSALARSIRNRQDL